MLDITKIRCHHDNILVRLDLHSIRSEKTKGGLYLPDVRDTQINEAVKATVIAAGPGHYRDKWLGLEQGMAPDGSSAWVPMHPDIRPGTRVLIEEHRRGDRIWSDEAKEYRMVREKDVAAIVEGE